MSWTITFLNLGVMVFDQEMIDEGRLHYIQSVSNQVEQTFYFHSELLCITIFSVISNKINKIIFFSLMFLFPEFWFLRIWCHKWYL